MRRNERRRRGRPRGGETGGQRGRRDRRTDRRLAREHTLGDLQRRACAMPTRPHAPRTAILWLTQYKCHHHQARHQKLRQTPGLITIHLFPSSRGTAAGLGDMVAWVTWQPG